MSPQQLNYFRVLLLEWKNSILSAAETRCSCSRTARSASPTSMTAPRARPTRASSSATRDRQRKLIAKIDAALRRIDDGEYGCCEVTGEPIGLNRLIARPIATMTVEAQQAHERREKISRDD